MWKAVFASVSGTSHIEHGEPCQDASRLLIETIGEETFLIAACADGAGSASRADVGAQACVDAFVAVVRTAICAGRVSELIERREAEDWVLQTRNLILDKARQLAVAPRELASTLLGAVLAERFAVFVQIGDGAMIIAGTQGFQTVFWPQSGEYANTTHFATDEDYLQRLEFCVITKGIDEFAAFTDGLERLILRFDNRSVHQPFLTSMLKPLAAATDPQPLFDQLSQYLSSEKINGRTNDDKTLILATRLNGDRDAG